MTEPYGVGTVSVANGGTTVTGTSTFWVGKVRKNDLFTVPAQGLFARVTADPTENDELAINGWPGTDLVDAEYEIISTYIAVDTASRTRELLLGLSLIDPNYDVQVDVLADRAAYDTRPGPTPTERGFAVLVSDIGDGRSAIHSKKSNASADWSDAAYFSGPTGGKGWSPQLVAESDGERRVLKLAGYVGGEGAEPTDNVGEYLKADGTWTATIGDAVDIRGEGFVFVPGEYDNGFSYPKNSVARQAGSSWITLQPTTGNAPPTLPTTSNAYWELMAQKGNDGAGTIVSLVEGDGISIDVTDPEEPIISVVSFTGDSGSGGAIGGVPAPAAGDAAANKFLKADGTWDTASAVLPPQGRLSLTPGVAVPESDVAGATSIYYVPNGGVTVPIYDGAAFSPLSIGTGLTLSLDPTSGHAGYQEANKNFDLFAISDGGTVRLGTGPAWNAGAVAGSNTARGTGAGSTELEDFGGILVNKNAMTVKWGSSSGNTVSVAARQASYLGSFRAVANGQASDTKRQRLLFNAYNQVQRALKVQDTGSTWTYSTGAYRQAHGSALNQIDVLSGLVVMVEATALAVCSNSTTTPRGVATAIGLDGVTVNEDVLSGFGYAYLGAFIQLLSRYIGCPGLGLHSLLWLEWGNGTDTQTWFGTGGGTALVRPGVLGSMLN